MMQAEFLHPGGIYDPAVFIELIESRVGCGMPSGTECDGDPGSGAFRLRYKGIDKRGFAHARLTYENAEVA